MKIRLSFKDPDALSIGVSNALGEMGDLPQDPDEREAILEIRRDKLTEACGRWVTWGEYLDIEIDTDAGTCVVLERKSDHG